ncbi:MAG: hypothetical protein ACREU8_04180 [Gammaproteobacteria bacterium]
MAEAIPIIENMVVAESSTHTLGAQPRMWSLIGSECAQLSEKDYSKLEFSCGGEDAECSEKRAFAQKYEAVLQEWKNGGAVSVQQKFRLLIENEKKLLKKSL